MRKHLIFVLPFCLLLISVSPALANHGVEVLGEEAVTIPQIPATSEGPGLILPDSPLFFLDELKQNVRLLFALSPEAKAKVHASVAGERLAELRFMLIKENKNGIDTALTGVSENLQEAADELVNAQLTGRNVSLLAKSLNTNIKEKQDILDVLEASDNREIKFKAKAAKEGLLEAKLKVEDSLPAGDLENELEDNIEQELEDGVEEASSSARGLQHAISVLNRLASQAAERNQTRRQEALRHAIEVKNDALQKQLEKLLDDEASQEAELLEAQRQASAQAGKAALETQKAAIEFRKAKNKVEEIRKQNQERKDIEKRQENKEKPSSYFFQLLKIFLKV